MQRPDAPIFSIIIPFKAPCAYLEESLPRIFELIERRFEVILLPDEPMAAAGIYDRPGIVILPTGAVSPAVKRDIGAKEARGEFLAFIDDDAYPDPFWLSAALSAFREHPEAAAVGGPAVTPEDDPFWAKVSGAVFLSRFSGGAPSRYLSIPPRRFVDDWPTVNLIVRKADFEAVGGFDNAYWPGEDTKFCLDLVNRTGRKILYLPELAVRHHRRPGLRKHLRQVGNYGLHRGHFARVHPETSRRPTYFIPSLWTLFFAAGLVFFPCSALFAAGVWCYLAALGLALLDIGRNESAAVTLAAAPYIVLTHFWYGIRFIKGFFTQTLTSSLGR